MLELQLILLLNGDTIVGNMLKYFLFFLSCSVVYSQHMVVPLLNKAVSQSSVSNGVWLTNYFITESLRSNFDGWVGCSFYPQYDVTISYLGRWIVSGNSGSHTIKILIDGNADAITSVSINTAGAPVGQFKYEAITPVTLTNGQLYIIASQEFNAGDQWYDATGLNASTVRVDVAKSTDAVYSAGGITFSSSASGDRDIFAPVDFKFQDIGALPSYIINQHFENTGYDHGETWTPAGAPEPDYTGVVLKGHQSFRVNAAGEYSETQWTGALSTAYSFCRFRLISLPGANDTAVFKLGTASSYVTSLYVDTDGSVQLFAGGSASSSSATTLTTGVTYFCWLKHVSSGQCELAISTDINTKPSSDGGGNVFLTKTGSADSMEKVQCATDNISGNETIFDQVLVDDVVIGANPL